jgi:hypothetical protein
LVPGPLCILQSTAQWHQDQEALYKVLKSFDKGFKSACIQKCQNRTVNAALGFEVGFGNIDQFTGRTAQLFTFIAQAGNDILLHVGNAIAQFAHRQIKTFKQVRARSEEFRMFGKVVRHIVGAQSCLFHRFRLEK